MTTPHARNRRWRKFWSNVGITIVTGLVPEVELPMRVSRRELASYAGIINVGWGKFAQILAASQTSGA
jgi:hypothetical protein